MMGHSQAPTPDAVLAMCLLKSLTQAGHTWVCLRGHQDLPFAVGNDIDLLVPAGLRHVVADLFRRRAEEDGWRELYRTRFGPLAQYFVHPESAHTLHIDIFDRIEWHFLRYVDEARILERRIWNGTVHTSYADDEIYLNLMGRLLYQGVIREKYRREALDFPGGNATLVRIFKEQLGDAGSSLAAGLSSSEWQPSESSVKLARRACATQFGLRQPVSAARGLARWAGRVMVKIAFPPGKLIVFEGAEGVGKSTLLEAIMPWCASWCAGRPPYRFHWNPHSLTTEGPASQGPVDPRAKALRKSLPGLAFVAAHLVGYWWRWIIRIRPRLSASHVVVADRYSYDLFLAPARFRLDLPLPLCRFSSLLAPSPDVVIALVADPTAIRSRMPELSEDEIRVYQNRLTGLQNSLPQMRIVNADSDMDEVISKAKTAILSVLLCNR